MQKFIFPTPVIIILYALVMFLFKSSNRDILFLLILAFFLHGLYILFFFRTYRKGDVNIIVPFLSLTVTQVITVLGCTFYSLFWGNNLYAMLHLTVLFLGMLTLQIFQQTRYLKRFEEGDQ